MTKEIEFKFQAGAPARCKVTGLQGILAGCHQLINGCVQYTLQPKCDEKENYLRDAWAIDEQSIELIGGEAKPFTHKFKFSLGDEVDHRINGFRGIITCRKLDMNGCERYIVEGKLDKDGKEKTQVAWAQEIELHSLGLNAPEEKPMERKRTGGPSTRETFIEKAI